MTMWPWILTYIHQNWVTWPGDRADVPIIKFIDLCIFEICGLKVQISGSHCQATAVVMATILWPLIGGRVVLMSAPDYEVDRPMNYCTFYLNTLRDLVALTFYLWTLE